MKIKDKVNLYMNLGKLSGMLKALEDQDMKDVGTATEARQILKKITESISLEIKPF